MTTRRARSRSVSRPLVGLGLALVLVTAAGACGSDDSATPAVGVIRVAAAFYPIEELATRVGGDAVEVTGLVPPGQGAHDYELAASQLEALEGADVVFYLGSGFQPGVEKAVASLPERVRRVDLLDSVELLDVTPTLEGVDGETDGETLAGGKDPHVWLDPQNMIELVATVEATLVELAVEDAAPVVAAAAAYRSELTGLSEQFASGLADCESRVIVTSHRAFEYLARRYELRQLPIAGISPSEEPSAKTLEAIAAEARAENVSVIFFEENLPAALSETLAAEIGASTDVLDPVEGLTEGQLAAGENYLTIMAANLDALRAGLGCR